MHRTSRGAVVALWAATAAAAFGLGRVTAPSQLPLAPDDPAGSVRAALGKGDALEPLARTTKLLEGLDAGQLPAVVPVYERMIPLIAPWELRLVFSAWARFDPAGALEHALAWPMRDRMEQRRVAVRATVERWAQADPASAHAAVEGLAAAHPRLRGDVWNGLATGWVHSEHGTEGLGAMLAGLRPVRMRDEAAGLALRELVRAGGADAALAWADTLLRDEHQEASFKRSVFDSAVRWAAGWDPARTGAWATPYVEADFAEDGILLEAELWGGADGEAAMAWLGEHPAGERRDRAVRRAFLEWSKADRAGAKAWLASISPTDFHGPAIEVWAGRLLAQEPVEAIGWCERILDTARQLRCLESAARSWYTRDAVAAETWLQQSPLDEETRSRVRRPAKKKTLGTGRARGPR